jgi:hypothetical protein
MLKDQCIVKILKYEMYDWQIATVGSRKQPNNGIIQKMKYIRQWPIHGIKVMICFELKMYIDAVVLILFS